MVQIPDHPVIRELERTGGVSWGRRYAPVGGGALDAPLWTGHAPNSIRVYAPGEALHNQVRNVRITGLYEDGVLGEIIP